MQNTGAREPTIHERTKAIPCNGTAISPASQGTKPQTGDKRPKGKHTVQVSGDCMVIHIALHHATEPFGSVAEASVHTTTQPILDGPKLGSKPLGNSLSFDREAISLPGPGTNMCEPQKIEGLRFAL